jgi:tetratricopeptide (TPR) repeat protein
VDSFSFEEVSEDVPLDEKIKKINEKISENPNNCYLYKVQAKLLLNFSPSIKRSEIALQSLEKYLKDGNEHEIESNCLVVRALRLKGDLESALSRAETLKNEFSSTAMLLEEVGRIHYQLGNLDESLKNLTFAHSKFPDNERITRALINTLSKLNNNRKVLELSNELLITHPNDSRTTFDKMYALASLNRINEAIETGEKFRNEFPDEYYKVGWTIPHNEPISFALQLASFYRKIAMHIKNRIRKEKLHLVIESDVDKKSNVKLDLDLEAKEFFEKCIFCIDDAISDDNTHDWSVAIILKARCLINLEQFNEALVLLDEISQIRLQTQVLYHKIFALFCLKDYVNVVKYSDEFLITRPTDKVVRRLRLASLDHVGDIKKKDEEWNKMEEYKKNRNQEVHTNKYMEDPKINYDKDNPDQIRNDIRKLEKDLQSFLRKNLPMDVFELNFKDTEISVKNLQKFMERGREIRTHVKKRGLDDVYSQITFGQIIMLMKQQKKFERKERNFHLGNNFCKTKISEITDCHFNDLEWLAENFRCENEHTSDDNQNEFTANELTRAKLYIEDLRFFFSSFDLV